MQSYGVQVYDFDWIDQYNNPRSLALNISRPLIFVAVPAVALALATSSSHAQRNEFNTSRMTLANYAMHTPAAEYMAEAIESYRREQYERAFGRYRLAANWANKHAQAWVAWMYLLGRGVERDPVRAAAWMKLSAERGYPDLVEESKNIMSSLSMEQRAHAELIYSEELLPNYGDEVAIPKTRREMRRDRMKASGSRVGYTGNIREIVTENDNYHSGAIFYAEDRWDFTKVIQFETLAHEAIAQGRVTLGDFTLVGDEVEQIRDESDSTLPESTDETDAEQ